MTKTRQLQESRLVFSKYTGGVRPKKASMATRLLSDKDKDGSIAEQTAKFPQGVTRLYLAIVNRAILDVLEKGENSRAAERWLLSRDFDRLEALFG